MSPLPPLPAQVDGLDLSGVGAVLATHGVLVAWLFGSRADGTARTGSDVDIGVLLPEEASWLTGQDVAFRVSAALHLPVDVVDLRTAPLELRAKVVQTGQLLYSADEPLRVRFVAETWARWVEVEPFVRRQTDAYLHHVATKGFARGRP